MDSWEQTFRTSRKVYILDYIIAFGLIFALLFAEFKGFTLNSFVMGSATLLVATGIILPETKRIMTSYKVNGNYLIVVHGLLRKGVKRVDLKTITGIELSQNFWQRMLNYGTIDIHSASGPNSMKIKNIDQPHDFVTLLEEKISKSIGLQ